MWDKTNKNKFFKKEETWLEMSPNEEEAWCYHWYDSAPPPKASDLILTGTIFFLLIGCNMLLLAAIFFWNIFSDFWLFKKNFFFLKIREGQEKS